MVLNVADAERALAWYCEVLGLQAERLDEWRRGEAPFVSVRLGPTSIIDLFELPRTGVNSDHVALVVEGVDLHELGRVRPHRRRRRPSSLFGARGVGTGLYLRDPDGNRLELRTYP